MKIKTSHPLITFVFLVGILFLSVLRASAVSADNPYPDGTLIRPNGYANVFVIQKNKKHSIDSIDVFNSYGYKWEDVKVVDQSIEHSYDMAQLVKLTDDSRVYFLANGKKIWIRTAQAFLSAGYTAVEKDVIEVNKFELGTYQDLKFAKRDTSRPSSDIPGAYVEGEKTVYVLSPFGTKRAIRSAAILESYGYGWSGIRTIPPQLVDTLPDTLLIRAKDDYKVYRLENGVRRWIESAEAFEKNGFSFDQVEEVSALDLSLYAEGSTIN